MCGIAGMAGPRADPELVREMTRRLAHRGPDGEGIWHESVGETGGATGGGAPKVIFGHRRLAILDPGPAGHQPMVAGDLVITYNGEIYNFPELRRHYQGELDSRCDTEVILRLYRDHGSRCVEHLEGMFAFAIWDRRRRRLFAARDAIGIKPLLYRPLQGGLAFASELKALCGFSPETPLATPEVDLTSLRDLFTYKYVPTPKTIYRDVFKLPPGHTMTWTADQGLTVQRFWAPDHQAPLEASHRKPLEAGEFTALFEGVVGDHLLSDVPLGVFLSGGIDSSAVTCAMTCPERGGKDTTQAFTLGFDVRSHDESAIAARVAAHLGAEHHLRRAEGVDLEQALHRYPELYDEPFGDHGAWAMHLVAQLAREHVAVALTGEGGDELFGGYHWYRKAPSQRASWHHHLTLRLLPALSATSRSAQRRIATGLDRYAMFLGPFTPLQKQSILHPELLRATGSRQEGTYDDLWHFRRHWRDDLPLIKRLQWIDLHTYLVDDMLTKVDRATMAVSLEARPPFVDRRIVDFALRLPAERLTDATRGKLVLRDYLRPRVPPETFERRKIGFSMPVKRWADRQPELLRGALNRLHQRGVLASSAIRPHNNEQVWTLLVLDRWFEHQRT